MSPFFFVTSDAISTCNFYRQTQRTTEIQLFLPTHNVGNAFVTDVLWHTQHQKHLIKRVLNWSGGWPVQGLGSGEHRLRLISGSSVGFRTPDGVRCATLPEQGTEFITKCSPWTGTWDQTERDDSRARVELLEPEGTWLQGGTSARLSPVRTLRRA